MTATPTRSTCSTRCTRDLLKGRALYSEYHGRRGIGQRRFERIAWEGGKLAADHLFVHQGVIPNVQVSLALQLHHQWDEGQLCCGRRSTPGGRRVFRISPSPATAAALPGPDLRIDRLSRDCPHAREINRRDRHLSPPCPAQADHCRRPRRSRRWRRTLGVVSLNRGGNIPHKACRS
jgi:hypothetical protein